MDIPEFSNIFIKEGGIGENHDKDTFISEYFFKRNHLKTSIETLHCTTMFSLRGKKPETEVYTAKEYVQKSMGQVFMLTIIGFCISPRAFSARLRLNNTQLKLWLKDDKERRSDVPPKEATPEREQESSACKKGSKSAKKSGKKGSKGKYSDSIDHREGSSEGVNAHGDPLGESSRHENHGRDEKDTAHQVSLRSQKTAVGSWSSIVSGRGISTCSTTTGDSDVNSSTGVSGLENIQYWDQEDENKGDSSIGGANKSWSAIVLGGSNTASTEPAEVSCEKNTFHTDVDAEDDEDFLFGAFDIGGYSSGEDTSVSKNEGSVITESKSNFDADNAASSNPKTSGVHESRVVLSYSENIPDDNDCSNKLDMCDKPISSFPVETTCIFSKADLFKKLGQEDNIDDMSIRKEAVSKIAELANKMVAFLEVCENQDDVLNNSLQIHQIDINSCSSDREVCDGCDSDDVFVKSGSQLLDNQTEGEKVEGGEYEVGVSGDADCLNREVVCEHKTEVIGKENDEITNGRKTEETGKQDQPEETGKVKTSEMDDRGGKRDEMCGGKSGHSRKNSRDKVDIGVSRQKRPSLELEEELEAEHLAELEGAPGDRPVETKSLASLSMVPSSPGEEKCPAQGLIEFSPKKERQGSWGSEAAGLCEKNKGAARAEPGFSPVETRSRKARAISPGKEKGAVVQPEFSPEIKAQTSGTIQSNPDEQEMESAQTASVPLLHIPVAVDRKEDEIVVKKTLIFEKKVISRGEIFKNPDEKVESEDHVVRSEKEGTPTKKKKKKKKKRKEETENVKNGGNENDGENGGERNSVEGKLEETLGTLEASQIEEENAIVKKKKKKKKPRAESPVGETDLILRQERGMSQEPVRESAEEVGVVGNGDDFSGAKKKGPTKILDLTVDKKTSDPSVRKRNKKKESSPIVDEIASILFEIEQEAGKKEGKKKKKATSAKVKVVRENKATIKQHQGFADGSKVNQNRIENAAPSEPKDELPVRPNCLESESTQKTAEKDHRRGKVEQSPHLKPSDLVSTTSTEKPAINQTLSVLADLPVHKSNQENEEEPDGGGWEVVTKGRKPVAQSHEPVSYYPNASDITLNLKSKLDNLKAIEQEITADFYNPKSVEVDQSEKFRPTSGFGSRAHITLGCAETVSPVEAGFDLVEVIEKESKDGNDEATFSIDGAVVKHYGGGQFCVYLDEVVRYEALFRGYY